MFCELSQTSILWAKHGCDAFLSCARCLKRGLVLDQEEARSEAAAMQLPLA